MHHSTRSNNSKAGRSIVEQPRKAHSNNTQGSQSSPKKRIRTTPRDRRAAPKSASTPTHSQTTSARGLRGEQGLHTHTHTSDRSKSRGEAAGKPEPGSRTGERAPHASRKSGERRKRAEPSRPQQRPNRGTSGRRHEATGGLREGEGRRERSLRRQGWEGRQWPPSRSGSSRQESAASAVSGNKRQCKAQVGSGAHLDVEGVDVSGGHWQAWLNGTAGQASVHGGVRTDHAEQSTGIHHAQAT